MSACDHDPALTDGGVCRACLLAEADTEVRRAIEDRDAARARHREMREAVRRGAVGHLADLVVVSYPRSGWHLLRAILDRHGYPTRHRHHPAMALHHLGPIDLHLVRHPFDVAVSAAAKFILRRPERDASSILAALPEAARGVARGAWGFPPWHEVVDAATEDRAVATIRFEDLVSDPVPALAAVGLRCPDAVETRRRIAMAPRGSAWKSHGFRSGRVGGWRELGEAGAEILETELGVVARARGYET